MALGPALHSFIKQAAPGGVNDNPMGIPGWIDDVKAHPELSKGYYGIARDLVSGKRWNDRLTGTAMVLAAPIAEPLMLAPNRFLTKEDGSWGFNRKGTGTGAMEVVRKFHNRQLKNEYLSRMSGRTPKNDPTKQLADVMDHAAILGDIINSNPATQFGSYLLPGPVGPAAVAFSANSNAVKELEKTPGISESGIAARYALEGTNAALKASLAKGVKGIVVKPTAAAQVAKEIPKSVIKSVSTPRLATTSFAKSFVPMAAYGGLHGTNRNLQNIYDVKHRYLRPLNFTDMVQDRADIERIGEQAKNSPVPTPTTPTTTATDKGGWGGKYAPYLIGGGLGFGLAGLGLLSLDKRKRRAHRDKVKGKKENNQDDR